MRRTGVRAAIVATLLAWPVSSCGPGTAEVVVPPVEIRIAGGDGQFGTTGRALQMPLHVVLTSIRTRLPVDNALVEWRIEAGSAELVGSSATTTDSSGSARVSVRLGAQTGPVAVRATVADQDAASVLFRLEAVDRPVLDAVSPSSAAPGASITLEGENFSPTPEQNVVLFSGVRGRVTTSTRTSMTVVVPECLPERGVEVTTQLGDVASNGRPLDVEAGGAVLEIDVGGTFDATDDGGLTCAMLPSDGSSSYLVMVQSASRIGAASHPFTFVGLAGSAATPSPPSTALVDVRSLEGGPPPADVRLDWKRHLRAREDAAIRRASDPSWLARVAAPTAPQPVPEEGERRNFQVYQSGGDFVGVEAEAEFVGERAAFFVDVDAPAGGYEKEDLELFSKQFDEVVYPEVTGRFGAPSDLDANERIVVLLTPAVNALTPRGASGFVGGFFFGIDLLPDENGSNSAEVFYALVPDPAGIHSDPRPKDNLLDVTPAILAHEFQHMVHFNERVLTRGADGNEAVWLSEGLAQFAEEIVAQAYEDESDPGTASLFRTGAVERARRYLARPDTVSVLITIGQGGLAERGAGFLHVLYLADRFGLQTVTDLTRTIRTGIDNVEAETGTLWPELLSDWWAANWLDGSGQESGALAYESMDLRSYVGDPFPIQPDMLGDGDFERTGSLRSSSVQYYIVNPAAGGTTTVRLGGQAGGVSLSQAEMRMRIVRIQ